MSIKTGSPSNNVTSGASSPTIIRVLNKAVKYCMRLGRTEDLMVRSLYKSGKIDFVIYSPNFDKKISLKLFSSNTSGSMLMAKDITLS